MCLFPGYAEVYILLGPGTEVGSATCKANASFAVLSLSLKLL